MLSLILFALVDFRLAVGPVRRGAEVVPDRPSSVREWSSTEKSYFIQVFLIANLVFGVIFAARWHGILSELYLLRRVWTVFVPYFLWGFCQEVVYRGILQTEPTRRWGPLRGILISNSIFTFGSLHFYHFSHTSPFLPMFAGIVAIGLFFSVLFWSSGNLWMGRRLSWRRQLLHRWHATALRPRSLQQTELTVYGARRSGQFLTSGRPHGSDLDARLTAISNGKSASRP